MSGMTDIQGTEGQGGTGDQAANTSPQTTETGEGQPPAAGRAAATVVGTVLMAGALVLIAVLAVDVAMKGRLLAPLFARLAGPRNAAAAAAEEGAPEDAGTPTTGE